jgi:hypothetical protein
MQPSEQHILGRVLGIVRSVTRNFPIEKECLLEMSSGEDQISLKTMSASPLADANQPLGVLLCEDGEFENDSINSGDSISCCENKIALKEIKYKEMTKTDAYRRVIDDGRLNQI